MKASTRATAEAEVAQKLGRGRGRQPKPLALPKTKPEAHERVHSGGEPVNANRVPLSALWSDLA